jgi:hypothetical protein
MKMLTKARQLQSSSFLRFPSLRRSHQRRIMLFATRCPNCSFIAFTPIGPMASIRNCLERLSPETSRSAFPLLPGTNKTQFGSSPEMSEASLRSWQLREWKRKVLERDISLQHQRKITRVHIHPKTAFASPRIFGAGAVVHRSLGNGGKNHALLGRGGAVRRRSHEVVQVQAPVPTSIWNCPG